MNKKEFLSALKETLAVLDERELRDIVDEYEQHIDMKVASGLSEEEAIADFGDFKELTAELLEAYHVRADYAAVNQAGDGAAGRQPWSENGQTGAQQSWMGSGRTMEGQMYGMAGEAGLGQETKERKKSFAGTLRGACVRLWNILLGAWLWLWKVLLWCCRQISRPFVWLAGLLGAGKMAASAGEEMSDCQPESEEESGQESQAETSEGPRPLAAKKRRRVHTAGRKGFWSNLGARAAAFGRWCAGVCVWWIHLLWNMCCVGVSVMIGAVGIFFLFMLGMFFVLLLNGYPMAGLTVAFLGAAMCLFAAAGFIMTLTWPKKRRIPAVNERDAAAPVGNERDMAAPVGNERDDPAMFGNRKNAPALSETEKDMAAFAGGEAENHA